MLDLKLCPGNVLGDNFFVVGHYNQLRNELTWIFSFRNMLEKIIKGLKFVVGGGKR